MAPDMAHTRMEVYGLRPLRVPDPDPDPRPKTHIHIEHRVYGCCNRQWIPSPWLTVCACQVPTVRYHRMDIRL